MRDTAVLELVAEGAVYSISVKVLTPVVLPFLLVQVLDHRHELAHVRRHRPAQARKATQDGEGKTLAACAGATWRATHEIASTSSSWARSFKPDMGTGNKGATYWMNLLCSGVKSGLGVMRLMKAPIETLGSRRVLRLSMPARGWGTCSCHAPCHFASTQHNDASMCTHYCDY